MIVVKYDIPIHLKCVEKFGWTNNDYFYCCHDCMIEDEINKYGYPYKVVTTFGTKSPFYFLGPEVTVSYLKATCLKLILDATYSSSNKYHAKINFRGVKVGEDIIT